jgi:hypothetical protein
MLFLVVSRLMGGSSAAEKVVSTAQLNVDFQKFNQESPSNDDQPLTLPPPADARVRAIDACLIVLTLFPAFPELDRVPAQNKGGKMLAQTNTVHFILHQ